MKKFVCDENMCAGCWACVDICPKNAIEIKDTLVAYNAYIDGKKCVECNLCHKTCPQNNPVQPLYPIMWKQGWVIDEEERSKSSSGGFATAIAKAFVRENGIVCSCTFKNGEFGFDFADTEEKCDQFTGSKYVKSTPKDVYSKIREHLKVGKKVLFIGLPCQVGGLKKVTSPKLQENLYTIDLICHGTPSPELLKKYLQQDFDIQLIDLCNLSFRSKTNFKLKDKGKKIVPDGVQDRYSIAFLRSVDYTQNCYHCQYARTERISDISLGDSWASGLNQEEDRKGVSLALCQTEKGKMLLENAPLQRLDVDVQATIQANKQLRAPSVMTEKHDSFFRYLKKTNSFNKAVTAVFPKLCLKQDIKTILHRIRIYGE